MCTQMWLHSTVFMNGTHVEDVEGVKYVTYYAYRIKGLCLMKVSKGVKMCVYVLFSSPTYIAL